MKINQPLHQWQVTPQEALDIQQSLRERVVVEKCRKKIRIVAGVDLAYSQSSALAHAVVVLMSYPQMEVIAYQHHSAPCTFPYVPGLLSFREIPHLLPVFASLKLKPDLVIVDGQGVAHPRRLGLASHLGLWLNIPTIGCAKSRLIGEFTMPSTAAGSCQPLSDKGETIGLVLRSKNNCQPLFISVGHLIDLESAGEIVKNCLRGYRLPEPTRKAHELVTALAGAAALKNCN